MCGRARLSSDVSEIKIAFDIPPERLTPNAGNCPGINIDGFLNYADRPAGGRHFVARITSRAKSAPRICIYERRRYSGRPSSSMRFSEATAMATSVICRPLVRERSASPITRL